MSNWLRKAGRSILSRALSLALLATLATCLSVIAPVSALGTESIEPANCIDVHLKPEQACQGIYTHSNFIQTESWDSRATGIGSCTGLVLETFVGKECIGDGSGYDEVYCTKKCEKKDGFIWMQNNNKVYGAYFTVWGQWE